MMPTEKETINSYNLYVQKWAERMRSGQNIAHEYLEKPAMYNKLPDLAGKTVLCVGCGTGEECNELMLRGAKQVVGIDLSIELIKYAKDSYPDIDFYVMDMEEITFAENQFDYVYSSLALHYVANWIKSLRGIRRVLKPAGIFLFSTHHPVRWGAMKQETADEKTVLMGYQVDKDTQASTFYGDYLTTRKVKDIWFDEFEVIYYHKPLSSILKEIIESEFTIIDFIEPKAVDAVREIDRLFWEVHQKIPLFMIIELRK